MRRVRGFSLLEVLLALVLLSVLLLGVYSGIRTATHGVRSGTAAVERLDQVRSTQQLLRREVAQAMVAPIGHDANGDALFFDGKADAMRFVAPLPGYLDKLGPQLLKLSLVDDHHGGKQLQLQLAVLPPDGKPPRPLGKPQLLLDHLKKGRFQYRGVDAQGRVGDWQDSWPDGRLMPQLVRIELTPEGTTPWPELTMPLRIDPSSGLMLQGPLLRMRAAGAR
ncbi:MAG: prepilin-type N-terminal cleavage/methylation domain-containing protein [Pseudomonadota bacterium]